jgi:hypothetical protein
MESAVWPAWTSSGSHGRVISVRSPKMARTGHPRPAELPNVDVPGSRPLRLEWIVCAWACGEGSARGGAGAMGLLSRLAKIRTRRLGRVSRPGATGDMEKTPAHRIRYLRSPRTRRELADPPRITSGRALWEALDPLLPPATSGPSGTTTGPSARSSPPATSPAGCSEPIEWFNQLCRKTGTADVAASSLDLRSQHRLQDPSDGQVRLPRRNHVVGVHVHGDGPA